MLVMGLLIEGAMQQAPQPGRQFVTRRLNECSR